MGVTNLVDRGTPQSTDATERLRAAVPRRAPMIGAGELVKRIPRVVRVLGAVVLLALVLRLLPGMDRIAPLVESDYCYQLLAADRMYEGLGPTSLQPVAPLQPWEWSYDWGFLTQWPIGYSALVCASRWLIGGTSLEAVRILSILCCSFAMIGWFLWLGRCVPYGGTRWIVALVGAASAVPVAFLLNPSTDVIVVAVLPWLMLLAIDLVRSPLGPGQKMPSLMLFRAALLGSSAGSLFWIRYASAFVPAALGAYLLFELMRRRIGLRSVLTFAVSSALPIGALVLVNRAFGEASSVSTTFNLGSRFQPEFSLSLVTQAWSIFSALGYYDHHAAVTTMLVWWPILAVAVLFVTKLWFSQNRLFRDKTHYETAVASRHGSHSASYAGRIESKPQPGARGSDGSGNAVVLNACVLVSALILLILATAVFGEKYHYVGLERYYFPIRPVYFGLFVLPMLSLRRRVVGWTVALAALVALNWTVRVDWIRAYDRSRTAQTMSTPYGQWVRSFGPDPSPMYNWLERRDQDRLVLISNFHEYLALETGMVTLPIPPDRQRLESWLERMRKARGAESLDVLFVFDPNNQWRSYWIPDTSHVVEMFDLGAPITRFAECDARVFRYVPIGSHAQEVARR